MRNSFSSESVTEGHPDKFCDTVSDAILDAILEQDPYARVAIETVAKGRVKILGEVTTSAIYDPAAIARQVVADIGYTKESFGIDPKDLQIDVETVQQSPDISQGVSGKDVGAGDQGCLKKGTLVRTNQGFIPIEEVREGDFVITPQGQRKVLVSRNTGKKKTLEICLTNGMTLECTPDHRILCYEKDGTTLWKPAANLTHDDFVCVLKPVSEFSNIHAQSEIARKTFFTKYNHKIFGPEEVTLDEDVGYITGELIGDGAVSKKNSMELAFGNNTIHLPLVKTITNSKFPNQWRTINSPQSISLKIDSVLVRKHFENFGLNYFKSPFKRTPKAVFTSPQPVIKAYLRGLFDSDGTIVANTGRNKKTIRVRLGSSSLQLLRETQLLLNDFGIKTTILFNTSRGTPVGKDKRYKSNYDSYVLSVVGFESYHNFAEEISFMDPKKKAKLEIWVKSNKARIRNSRGLFLIPHPKKQMLIDEKHLHKNLPFAVVRFKESKEKKTEDVYDLEIQGVHTFSGNGIIVHNSMFGFACKGTEELMPLPITLAHRLAERLTKVRKDRTLSYLRPDGKTQVTIDYTDPRNPKVAAVVVAAQHDPDVENGQLRGDIERHVIAPVLELYSFGHQTARLFINNTGRFVQGGPMADAGLTGRKIIADTYGGACGHGGGAFSGKDPTKVDRSVSYMLRHIAKNIVAADLADICEIQLAYVIGGREPVSLNVNTHGTERVPLNTIYSAIEELFPLSPGGIITYLDLRSPIFRRTTNYGHFGRPELPWENTNRIEDVKRFAKPLDRFHDSCNSHNPYII